MVLVAGDACGDSQSYAQCTMTANGEPCDAGVRGGAESGEGEAGKWEGEGKYRHRQRHRRFSTVTLWPVYAVACTRLVLYTVPYTR